MRGLALTVLLGVLVVGAGAVGAADWGGVIPGESTKETVRARHGDPTRATTQKVDRFDSAQWVYEGDQAPTGMFRMTVDFGLAGPAGFRADVVRSFKLEPHPGIFTRPAIVDGWGRPSGAAPAGQPPAAANPGERTVPATSRSGVCLRRRSASGRSGSPSKSMIIQSPSARRSV